MNPQPRATANKYRQKIASVQRWAVPVLLLAGLYNILWGAWVVLFPMHFFDLTSAPRPNYPQFWQCIGMIVGVYGVGYLAAATDPLRHWPVVLVGFMGKIFGPIGFVQAVVTGALPLSFGWLILFNDLIWWLPFGFLLLRSWQAAREDWFARAQEPPAAVSSFSSLLETYRSPQGKTLLQHSQEVPLLVVFLRHSGCTFCRETLADLASKRHRIEAAGILPVLVDMYEDDSEARAFYQQYRLADLPRFHDASRRLYRAFGLRRGTIGQLLGLSSWIQGFRAGVLEKHGVGWLKGDGLQMPGAFILHNGKMTAAFRHQKASDRPDLEALACTNGACAVPAKA